MAIFRRLVFTNGSAEAAAGLSYHRPSEANHIRQDNSKREDGYDFRILSKNIRYEQEYIEHGEIIPNAAYLIFSRKYGDCKDYARLCTLWPKA